MNRLRFSVGRSGGAADGAPYLPLLIHLPSQVKIIDLDMQNACKDAAEKFAALDLNWWTCVPEEVIGPDLQEMRGRLPAGPRLR